MSALLGVSGAPVAVFFPEILYETIFILRGLTHHSREMPPGHLIFQFPAFTCVPEPHDVDHGLGEVEELAILFRDIPGEPLYHIGQVLWGIDNLRDGPPTVKFLQAHFPPG